MNLIINLRYNNIISKNKCHMYINFYDVTFIDNIYIYIYIYILN